MIISFFYLIPALLLLAVISWHKTKYGLFLILALMPAFLIRTKIFFIPSTWLELAIYTVFAVWLAKDFIKTLKHKNIKTESFDVFGPYVLPILLFLLAAVISTFISHDLRLAAGMLKAWFFDPLLFLIVFISEGRKLSSADQYQKYSIYALIAGATAISLYGLYEYVIGFGLHIAGRLDSIFVSPNYLSLYLAPISLLVFGLIFYDRAIRVSEKFFLSASLIILLANIYLAKSYSGWLALIVGLAVLWLSLPKRKIKFILLIIGLIVFLPLMIYEASTSRFRHYDSFWQISSKDTRMLIWQAALSTGINQPILGAGLGGFRFAYQDYIKTLPKLPPEREAPFPHNLYLTLWLETGLLGLISFLWLIIIFFSQLFKRDKNQAPNYLNIIIAAGLLAILVHGLTDTSYFKNDLALLFWFLIGIERVNL